LTISRLISELNGITWIEKISLLSFALSKKKEEILIRPNETVTEEKFKFIKTIFEERKNGRPLAYIINSKEFFSEEFFVNESVLIPRPETEILVEEAINIIKDMKGQPNIMDVGTGSGIIGIMIAKHTGINVLCLDISREALRVASKNSERIGVKGKTFFVCSDLLEAIKEKGNFHVIVANLPYVKTKEWEHLMKDVRDYEPKLALLGGEDGLDLYRRLIRVLERVICEKGWFLCEVGGAEQAEVVSEMLIQKGFNVSKIKDYSGTERIIKAQWINSL